MKNILLVISISCLFFTSCDTGGKRVRGNGNIITTERTVSSFSDVELYGNIDVYIMQGDLQPVRLEGDDNLLPYIEINQEKDQLIIRNRKGFDLSPSKDLKAYVTAPVFKNISVSGASDITGENKISNNDYLRLQVSGAGDINMEVDVPEVKAEISGSGSVNLKGQTKDFDLDLSGAGNAHCYDLISENTEVDISGAGDAEVYASVGLNAEVSGAGTVRYKGKVQNIKQHVSGAGSIKSAD